MPSYNIPFLAGLTVAQATVEWRHRVPTKERIVRRPNNTTYKEIVVTETWAGFTGDITPEDADPDAIVAGFTTDPPYTVRTPPWQYATWPDIYTPRGQLVSTASLHLLLYTDLVTPGSDELTTPDGDQLVVAI